MQEQSTAKIAATTNKTAKLDFNRLEEKPRLCIKSKTDGGYGYISSNDQYFLCCPSDGFILIDKEGHEQELDIKRDFVVDNVRWSSYLQKFVILSNDQKLYTLDPIKQQLKMVKSLRGNSDMAFFTCYENTLVLWPREIKSSIEIYRLSSSAATDDDELIIKSLETPIQISKIPLWPQDVDSVRGVCFSSDGKYLGVVTYFIDDCDHAALPDTMFHLLAFRHDGSENLEWKSRADFWDCWMLLIALPDEKFLVRGRSETQLLLMDYSTSTASINISDGSSSNNHELKIKYVAYNIQSKILSAALCGNCLAIEGPEGEIQFYDL